MLAILILTYTITKSIKLTYERYDTILNKDNKRKKKKEKKWHLKDNIKPYTGNDNTMMCKGQNKNFYRIRMEKI